MPERTVVNNLEFSRQGAVLRGVVPVAALERLRESLLAAPGELDYTLLGSTGDKGEPLLELSVGGRLVLQCQRCLEPLDYPLQLRVMLRVVAGGSEFEMPEDEDETVDSIPASAAMDVLELVEDEILLGLPISPLHAAGTCEAFGGAGTAPEEKVNPFAALAALKGKL